MRAPLALALLLGFSTAAHAAEPKPALDVAMVEARTHPDGRWFGENAYHFRLSGVKGKALEGQTVTWTVQVKRKVGPWKSAKAWLMEKQAITAAAPARDVAFALLYRSLAKAGFQPGQHVAAFTATTANGTELYRNEINFVLPGAGPNAFKPTDFVKR